MPARGKSVRQHVHSDPIVQQNLNNTNQAVNDLSQSLLASNKLLTRVPLASGTTSVAHGLGQALNGWLIVRWHGATATVYDLQDGNATPADTLILHSSAAVTVDILVF